MEKLSRLTDAVGEMADRLDEAVVCAPSQADVEVCARYHRDQILPAMQKLRAVADEAELCVAKDIWPYPSYGEMLFSVM